MPGRTWSVRREFLAALQQGADVRRDDAGVVLGRGGLLGFRGRRDVADGEHSLLAVQAQVGGDLEGAVGPPRRCQAVSEVVGNQ